MPEPAPLSAEELHRQIRNHLESLRAAGVEWLPMGQPLVPRRIALSVETPRETQAGPRPVALGNAAPASLQNPTLLVHDEIPADQRRQALQVLGQEVAKCSQCAGLASTRTQTVFGQGAVDAELCFVGEAPGADEDAQGLAFVGAAGQLLTKILEACGLKREEVYICNIIKCRPPGNRTPLPNEAANCRGFLERQLELVRPKYLVAMGGCAASNLLNTTLSLARLRGRFHEFRGIPVWVTYHPAYLLPHRHPEKKREVWDDMKMLMAKIGRVIPERRGGPNQPPPAPPS